MTTARDIMTAGAECVGADESVLQAARKMTELDVGALPICGTDNRLKGMLTDRDIVVKVLGKGKDPERTTASWPRAKPSPSARTTTPGRPCAR